MRLLNHLGRPLCSVVLPLLAGLVIYAPAWAKPIMRGGNGRYIVSEFVATTPQRAWAVLSNFNNQAEWAPDIRSARIVKRNGNQLDWSKPTEPATPLAYQ